MLQYFETILPLRYILWMVALLEVCDVILTAIFDLIEELEKKAKQKLHIRKYFASFQLSTNFTFIAERS